jgi:hypothetical protein
MSILTPATLNTLIKQINKSLKSNTPYTDEEVHYMRQQLRNYKAQRRELTKGNGFGN